LTMFGEMQLSKRNFTSSARTVFEIDGVTHGL
jgi:hypothetical protein